MKDTRPFHSEMFAEVVPKEAPKFAGHYRGSSIPYLAEYRVSIAGFMGEEPARVEGSMVGFHNSLVETMDRYEKEKEELEFSKEHRLLFFANLLCEYAVTFLAIHPYANGNGHISRMLVYTIFTEFGINVVDWDLDKRPEEPFDKCISLYRQGQKDFLISYFLTKMTQ